MIRRLRTLAAPFMAVIALGAQELPGIAELQVSPSEVVFGGRTRSQNLTVRNTSRVAATYRITLQHVRMTEAGGAQEVESFPHSAADLLRYSPHQVVLQPGESQTVRLVLRRPEDLSEGEYRIHALFRVVPPEPIASSPSTEGLRISLRPIPGIAIPVFVRHGDLRQALQLDSLAWQETPCALTAIVRQQGNQTVRGLLQLVRLAGRKPEIVTQQPFVHYADLPLQRIRLALPGGRPGNGTSLELRVVTEAGKVICSSPLP